MCFNGKGPKQTRRPQVAKGRRKVKPQTMAYMKTKHLPRHKLRPKMSLRKSAQRLEPFTPTFGSAESEKPEEQNYKKDKQQDDRPSFTLGQSFKDHQDDHM